MKDKIKTKFDERIDYILSKNVSDITNEEFEVLRNKWNSINIEENQNNNNNTWLLLLMLIFLSTGNNKKGDNENV